MFDQFEAKKSCCTPQRPKSEGLTPPAPQPDAASGSAAAASAPEGMIRLEGGKFRMGYEGPEAWVQDGEGPVREVELAPFWLDETAVSNAHFEQFVLATGYVTESERFGWSHVFLGQLSKSKQRKLRETRAVEGL